jgi:hypothetical protein
MQTKIFLARLFRRTHWLRVWAQLQRHEEQRDVLIHVCGLLEESALQFFASSGWLFIYWLGWSSLV